MNFNKKKINIICIFIAMITSSITAVGATTYLYNSNEVGYTNTTVTGDNVQTAIDEIHTESTNYVELKQKLNKLEAYFPSYTSGGTTYHPYSNAGANLGMVSGSYEARMRFDYNGVDRAHFVSDVDSNGLRIVSNDASGTWGQGTINLKGNPVKIKGADTSYLSTYGQIVNGTEKATSIASSTTAYPTINQITIPTTGKWLLFFGARFGNNGTGYRYILLSPTAGDDSTIAIQATARQPGYAISYNYLHTTVPLNVTTAGQIYYLKAQQNSGGNLAVRSNIYAIKIK